MTQSATNDGLPANITGEQLIQQFEEERLQRKLSTTPTTFGWRSNTCAATRRSKRWRSFPPP
jgi:hypothetical protein